jgi:tRNA A-37 threonylcarbamoyl transferase component Bud32
MMGVFLNVQHHDQFARAQQDVPILFSLKLKHSNANLTLKQCLRVVPGKRIVALASWKGKDVIAKVFFQPNHSKRHLTREVIGITTLNNASIPSPTSLLEDECEHDSAIQVLLLERIFPADSFFDVWQETERNQQRSTLLLQQAIDLIVDLHLNKLIQIDFHMNNLLVQDGKLIVVDAGMLTICKKIVPKKAALNNLARFLAQFSFPDDEKPLSCLSYYLSQRGYKSNKRDLDYFNKRINHWFDWRYHNLSKKLFRNCTQFNRHKLNKLILIADRSYDNPKFIKQFKCIYDDPTSATTPFSCHRIGTSLFGHKVKNFWRRINKLYSYGVACPKPAALLFGTGIFSKGIVLVEAASGLSLKAFNKASVHDKTRKTVQKLVEDEIKKLNRIGYTVPDPEEVFLVCGEKVMLTGVDKLRKT